MERVWPSVWGCIVLCVLCGTRTANSQVISQFSWDASPVTNADVGPNATSVSSSATSSSGGVGGTNGLNAGLPKRNLDFVIPTSSGVFDVNGIDVSFAYQREESGGTFFQRGQSLIINGCATLSVSYRVENGAGGFFTVNSGNVYSIPFDDIFRTFRFYYLPSTGLGALTVDGAIVWSNDGADNRGLYWSGAGDIVIGGGMDGTGFDQPFLDDLIIGEAISPISPLPIELVFFSATPERNSVLLEWETASEIENDHFTVERSVNAETWQTIERIDGAVNSSQSIYYTTNDTEPLDGLSYYRLKQTDTDGTSTHSRIVSVFYDLSIQQVNVYPNPAETKIIVKGAFTGAPQWAVYNALGREVSPLIFGSTAGSNSLTLDISSLAPGSYLFVSNIGSNRFVKY